MPDKRYGVRLTLPGAPAADHNLNGLPLTVRPDDVTPVPPELVARVRDLIKSGADLELIPVDDAPWQGYDDRTVEQIVKRLSKADQALTQRVADYETANKARDGVLTAASARIQTIEQGS